MSIEKVSGKTTNDEVLNDKLYMLDSHIQYQINQMKNFQLGKLLTIVEASINDKEQRRALKDIVKDTIWEKEYFSSEISQIIIQFANKYTDIPTEELEKYWKNRGGERVPSGNWFKK